MTHRTKWLALLFLLPATVFLVVACEGETEEGMEEAEETGEEATEQAPMGGEEDVSYAERLWDRIEGYEDWTVPAGFEGWQEGKSPHGKVLRYYVNDAAADRLTKNGAIIVKENYPEESEDALAAVTVMEKREGYAPDHGDWYWVKYQPNGDVAKNEKGAALAGKVGLGGTKGCIPCHQGAGGDDFLFMND